MKISRKILASAAALGVVWFVKQYQTIKSEHPNDTDMTPLRIAKEAAQRMAFAPVGFLMHDGTGSAL